MGELRQLMHRWYRGWSAARDLPEPDVLDSALRVRCMQPGREVEYVALDADPVSLAGLVEQVVAEDSTAWLTVPTTSPERAAERLEAAGLVLIRHAETLMTTDLRAHPQPPPAPPYELHTEVDGAAVTATVLHPSGELGARGTMGFSGADGVADRIETMPDHRRKGLASTVMGALAAAAVERGVPQGVLIASEEGRLLYTRLGWEPVATVLVAARQG